MNQRLNWRDVDWLLLLVVLILVAFGITMVYSATFTTEDLSDYWLRQLVFALIGLTGLVIMALFDYRHLELLAPPSFILFVMLLVAVFLFGDTQGTGSQRWLNIGGTLVQPTEAGKFLMIVFMAWYLSWFQDRMHRLPYLIGALALLLGPLALIYLQPDLGMAVTYAFIGGMLILVSGIRYWQLFMLTGSALATVPFFLGTLQGYMLERLDVFFNPEANQDAAFNINQALIAIGAGGWMGRGWAHGSQNQLHFLRVRHTDFIFSVISEELGWIGAMLALMLLFFVVWRLLRIADMARDHFGRLLAVGVAGLVFFQIVVNVGMNLSLVPVTGLTLPFISYGGSSLVSMMLAIGLAQSVAMRHRKIEFQ
ncbi:MAG: FtsW/RodA/SpoVE family cell cycle protein [Chloroflexota bacterium]|nr:FtsW/RodA/SpoVE family cell cycle protein [Chloroflexota bacterium]